MKLRIVIDRLEDKWEPHAWYFRIIDAWAAYQTYRFLKNSSLGIQYRLRLRWK